MMACGPRPDIWHVALLAIELASMTRRSGSGRSYTVAEHAVILSTYIKPGLGHLAIIADAMTLGLLPGLFPDHLRAELDAAEARLERDESGIAFLPATHAAQIYVTRTMELHP